MKERLRLVYHLLRGHPVAYRVNMGEGYLQPHPDSPGALHVVDCALADHLLKPPAPESTGPTPGFYL